MNLGASFDGAHKFIASETSVVASKVDREDEFLERLTAERC